MTTDLTKEREWRFRLARQSEAGTRLKEILDGFIAEQREFARQSAAAAALREAEAAELRAAAAAAAAIGRTDDEERRAHQ